MELIEWILQDENINKAIKSVKKNKGAYGIDKMSVEDLTDTLPSIGKKLNPKYVTANTSQYQLEESIYPNPTGKRDL